MHRAHKARNVLRKRNVYNGIKVVLKEEIRESEFLFLYNENHAIVAWFNRG